MLGKVTKITLGVTAGLVAAAPLAYAGGTGYDTEPASDGGHHGHHFDGGKACKFDGGSADAGSLISGDTMLANAVAQAPIGGNNIANLANCSDFLNHNLNHNLSDNEIAIGDNLLP